MTKRLVDINYSFSYTKLKTGDTSIVEELVPIASQPHLVKNSFTNRPQKPLIVSLKVDISKLKGEN